MTFEKLQEKRKKWVEAEDENEFGTGDVLANLYSDKSRFIFEILQNAEDAGASEIKFIIHDNKLEIIHDGNDFTLGDIDSISAIAKSSKSDDYTKIGTHGVGFKSVYSITKTPRIHSDIFNIEITDFVYPNKIDPIDGLNGTKIILPFNRNNFSNTEIVDQLVNKLEKLDHSTLLFMSNIDKIEWKYGDRDGRISRQVINDRKIISSLTQKEISCTNVTIESENIKNEYISFHKNVSLNVDSIEKKLKVDIAYKIQVDEMGDRRIIPMKGYNAFVYFQTEHETHLDFLIQGPFSTTPSRDKIPLEEHVENSLLLDNIGDLVAESLEYLRDINMLNINTFKVLPIDLSRLDEGNKIYDVVYHRIKKLAFASDQKLIPINNSSHTCASECIIADSSWLVDLLDTKMCIDLFNRGYWINREITSNSKENNKLYYYFRDELKMPTINSEKFGASIDKDFLTKQTDEWMIEFYNRISGIPSLWQEASKSYYNRHNEGLIRKKEIIRDENNIQIRAFNDDGNPNIYIKNEESSTELFNYVKPSIYAASPDFFKKFGLCEPDLLAQLRDHILPSYNQIEAINEETINIYYKHLEMIILCYEGNLDAENSNANNELISLMRKSKIILCNKNNSDELYLSYPEEVYFPSAFFFDYFQNVDTAFYVPLSVQEKYEHITKIFTLCGVDSKIKCELINNSLDDDEKASLRSTYENGYMSEERSLIDYTLSNLDYVLDHISLERSLFIWQSIIFLGKNSSNYYGTYKWFYRHERSKRFESYFIRKLQKKSWILFEDEFVSPSKITIEELPNSYTDCVDEIPDYIEKILGFYKEISVEEKLLEEHPELADKLAVINDADRNGIDLKELLDEKIKSNESSEISPIDSILKEIQLEEVEERIENFDYKDGDIVEHPVFGEGKIINNANERVSVNFENDVKKEFISKYANLTQKEYTDDNYIDSEESIENKISNFKNELEDLNQKILNQEMIKKIEIDIQNSEKYTFKWMFNMLVSEYSERRDLQSSNGNRRYSVSFSTVKRVSSSFIVLKDPSSYIPNHIEDLDNITLTVYTERANSKINVDVVNVKDNQIKVKIIGSVDSLVINNKSSANLEITNPLFLIERLIQEYQKMNLEEKFNFKENIDKNTEFIFGPPGTGKTTLIAQTLVDRVVRNNLSKRVLILTPTNKSADVITKKIMDISENQNLDYSNWLIRYGSSSDVRIEEAGIVRNLDDNPPSGSNYVLITTIVRLPYAKFNSSKINKLDWSEVYFDESSMIHVAYSTYALQKLISDKFIFAGDPFQILPIMNKSQWSSENIYKMVELCSFKDPKTNPVNFTIKKLTTQYRSVPSIGEVYNKFAYDNVLTSNKSNNDRNKLKFGNDLLKTFTRIRIPVNNSDRLFKSISLDRKSPYQIYSAILSVEFAKELAENIEKDWESKENYQNHSDESDLETLNKEKWTIGIICPYRSQSQIVERMISSSKFQKCIIVAGTIHGFQGDECDIIITLLNSSNKLSTKQFINNFNILNVAISRAKQYLVIIAPEKSIKGYSELNYLTNIDKLIDESKDHKEYKSEQIEYILFNNERYISSNSYVTTHKKVNLYDKSEYKYEIRCNDEAIDIHIS